MRFYRGLQPFKVMSFDLDDTLYDNSDVIRLAEERFLQCVQEHAQLSELTSEYWREWKWQLAEKDPLIAEDVIAWRVETLRHLLTHHGKSAVEIDRTLAIAMEEFIEWRHKIDVPAESIEVLNQLKDRYLLSVITNGNVIATRIGLEHFQLSLRGGEQGRAKPHQDLFHQTADHFGVKPNEILHIGDNLTTDVQGAIQAGCQAVWINLSGKDLNSFTEASVLPTLEINHLTELLTL